MHPDIRLARSSDLDALVALEAAAFESDRISRRSFRRLIASRSASVLLAQEAGGVIGCAVMLYRARSRAGRLYSIAVGRQGSGVGRALLQACEREAVARGCSSLALEVREDNLRAQEFYRRSGFLLDRRMPDYYADGVAALRLYKDLAEAGLEAA